MLVEANVRAFCDSLVSVFVLKPLKGQTRVELLVFFFFPLNVMHCVRRYQINDTLTLFVLSATGLTKSSERCSEEERTHLGSKVNVRQEAGGAGCSLVRRSSRWPSPPR